MGPLPPYLGHRQVPQVAERVTSPEPETSAAPGPAAAIPDGLDRHWLALVMLGDGGHAARARGHGPLGSMPFALSTGAAAGAFKNWIRAWPAAPSRAAAPTPAA